jgi:hypothetical protein
MTCTGALVTASRYYPIVTNGVLTIRFRSDIVLHVRPPSASGLTRGSTAVTGRQGERAPGINPQRLSE